MYRTGTCKVNHARMAENHVSTVNDTSLSSSSSSSSASSLPSSSSSSSFRSHPIVITELNDEASAELPSTPLSSSAVPADQERQLLLLMLLAQVCALHDPTPKTFTVHVLELFERGMLDRHSIRFLFDLGLVPPRSSPRLEQGTTNSDDLIATEDFFTSFVNCRSAEASRIRTKLERLEELQGRNATSSGTSNTVSWSAVDHPLSLSKFQREFHFVRSLSAGAFGEVCHVRQKMDDCEYAIKRVPFSAHGYSQETLKLVIREVQCLAVCDHPNVVRYFTSWLEPSWMTGSGGHRSVSTDDQKLLTMMKKSNEFVEEVSEYDDDDDDEQSAALAIRRATAQQQFSFAGLNRFDLDELDSQNTSSSRRADSYHQQHNDKPIQDEAGYKYQICLYIQMQLCRTVTLADWIREKNQQHKATDDLAFRVKNAASIFKQISRGLDHIHQQGIIHRDLKPANIFASVEEEGQYRIGDFGLSTLLDREASSGAPPTFPAKAPYSRFRSSGPLTAGVGTASYVAPEQLSSCTYGIEADIFSLGLILLELLCPFSTEHERLETFQKCQEQREIPEHIVRGYSMAATTILECTAKDPLDRPTAAALVCRDIQSASSGPREHDLARSLQAKLIRKEDELRACREELKEKDRIIDDLIRRLNHQPVVPPSPTISHDSIDGALSSSDDEL